jgi:DNA polymerase-1
VKLLAVDGNNLLMRALHATKRAGMTAHGVQTGPLHVFATGLSRHIREECPTHIAVAWDSPGRGIRGEIDGQYKANRLPMPDEEHELRDSSFALAKEFCTHAGIYQTEYPTTGVEADDIIASWWRDWLDLPPRDPSTLNNSMVILSSDKDLLQLVDRIGIEQVRLSSANAPTDRWNAAKVQDHFGVPARTVPAILAIAGDTSDNVIGVRNVGPKRAAKALNDCGLDFERTIAERWPDDVDRLRANYRLTDLRSRWQHASVPSPALPPGAALVGTGDPRFDQRWSPFLRFLDAYDLASIKTKLVARLLWTAQPPGRQVGRPLRPH